MEGQKVYKIYLAGNISSDPRTYEWREQIETALSDRYIVLNPAANLFNQNLIKKFEGDSEGFLKSARKRSQGLLIVKDYNTVLEADIIVFNFKVMTVEKPPIGTIFELSWSWLLKKPVIAIVSKGDNLYKEKRMDMDGEIYLNKKDLENRLSDLYSMHPFPKAVFSAEVHSAEEACKIIDEFFWKVNGKKV